MSINISGLNGKAENAPNTRGRAAGQGNATVGMLAKCFLVLSRDVQKLGLTHKEKGFGAHPGERGFWIG
jgi:hypothetical protein